MNSLFTGIDSSRHAAVTSAKVIIDLYVYFMCIVLSLLLFFQIDLLEPSFTDSVFRFRIPELKLFPWLIILLVNTAVNTILGRVMHQSAASPRINYHH